MNCQEKINWVIALLGDRVHRAKKGEAEVFVSKFEYSVNQKRFHFHHIYDEESAEKFLKAFSYSPHGGKLLPRYSENYILINLFN